MTEDPFFKANPKYANLGKRNRATIKAWESVATDYDGIYEGAANGLYIDATVKYPFKYGNIAVKVKRQLESAEGAMMPRLAPLTERTVITMTLNVKPASIQIIEKTFLVDCWAYLFGAKHYNEHYWIKTADDTLKKEINQSSYFQQSFQKQEILSFSTNSKKNKVKISYCKVFESELEIRTLLEHLEVLVTLLNRRVV